RPADRCGRRAMRQRNTSQISSRHAAPSLGHRAHPPNSGDATDIATPADNSAQERPPAPGFRERGVDPPAGKTSGRSHSTFADSAAQAPAPAPDVPWPPGSRAGYSAAGQNVEAPRD